MTAYNVLRKKYEEAFKAINAYALECAEIYGANAVTEALFGVGFVSARARDVSEEDLQKTITVWDDATKEEQQRRKEAGEI